MESPLRQTASEVEYDLTAVLVKAATLYEKRLGSDWLLFAPDWLGWPVLVNDAIHELLDHFRNPSAAGDVLGRLVGRDAMRPTTTPDLAVLANAVAFLEDGGFLRGKAAVLPYPAPSRTESSSPKVLGMWLHMTNACNLDCAYCFVAKKDAGVMHDSVCDATAETLARTAIANRLEKVIVKFAGGEPTLVLPVVERFRARLESALAGTGILTHAALLSNGTHIDDRVIAFLKRPNSSISISLDGYGDAHDIYRRTKAGAPTWIRIVSNFDLLQHHGVTPFVMATVSDRTRHGLPELIRWVLSRGLRTRIGVVRELGRGPTDEAECTAYGRRMAAAFDKSFELLESERIPFDPRRDLEICELRFDQPADWVACGIGSTHLVVRPDGNLASCPMTVEDPGQPPGEDLLAACRRTFPFTPASARVGIDGAECLSCRWFPVCAGGCPVNNERTRGHPFARSPLCEFYQAVIPRYLDLFGRKLRERRGAETKAQTN
jgi:uncharacterized protein